MKMKLVQEIMDLAVEDYTSLCDIRAAVEAAHPGLSVDEHIKIARMLVLDLLSRGFIEVYYDNHNKSTETYRHVVKLSTLQIQSELWKESHWRWRSPSDETTEPVDVAIGATAAGEKALISGAL